MLWDTLERVNRLRQEALSNTEFVESAKEHEEALLHEQHYSYQQRSRLNKNKSEKKALSEIYKEIEFGSGAQH